jgi:hypothetical protein
VELTFYDRSGKAAAYCEDGTHIFLFSGHAAGFIHEDSIYDYSGKHLGWIIDGWVREHTGRCVYYTDDASDGPLKPLTQGKPAKVVKQIPPSKGATKPRIVRPDFPKAWSALTGQQFFKWYRSN